MLRLIPVAFLICLMSLISPATPPDKSRRAGSASIPQQQSSSRKGSITGRVICEEGQMPANLRINLWSPADRGTSQRVVIDEAGRFRADDLAPRAYLITAYAPGYISAETASRQNYYHIGDVITLRIRKGGVITGTVSDANGEPVAGVQVRALRVRDAEGRRLRARMESLGKTTDDRGVYRIYGLPPGSYHLVTAPLFKSPSTESDTVVPTYYPSATRDTAAEVPVQAGQEATNIDIRLRNEGGHTISGIVRGAVPQDSSRSRIWIGLSHTDLGMAEASPMIFGDENNAFAIDGLPDGEYLVSARVTSNQIEAASASVRVRVKGADVTGLELTLMSLGSISGRIVLEQKPQSEQSLECKEKRGFLLVESLLNIHRDLAKDEQPSTLLSFSDVAPDEKGQFKFVSLEQSRYRIGTRLPTDNWYVRSITLPATGNKTRDVSVSGIAVKQGEKVDDLTITVSEGAASIRGKVVSAREGATIPSRLRVHLIPAEREAADDLLRYREVEAESSGAFALTNIAPGKYRIIARPATEDEKGIVITKPVAWDAQERKRLRAEAESAEAIIDLKSCERAGDYLLRYVPPTAVRPLRNGL